MRLSAGGSPHRVRRRILDRLRPGGARTVLEGPAAGLRLSRRHASGDYASGTNERPVQDAIVGLLGPGDTFFDIGANVGFFSLLAARCVGPTGTVVAFEAVPEIAETLRGNARSNHLAVTVRSEAVGAAAGRATLRLTRHPGGATIDADADATDVIGAIEVDVVSIDELVAGGAVSVPDVVKIDVEGHEEPVLDGMAQLIATRAPALVIELDGAEVASLEARLAAVEARLRSAGYETERLRPSYPVGQWAVAHVVARRS